MFCSKDNVPCSNGIMLDMAQIKNIHIGFKKHFRWYTIKNQHFDRKIGIFPFLLQEPTQKSSKNQVCGTMVTKPIDNITKEVVKSMLIEKLIFAVHQKWPCAWVGKTTMGNNIIVQQDNAKSHPTSSEPDLAAILK